MKILIVFLFVVSSIFALTPVRVKVESGPVLSKKGLQSLLESKNAHGRIVGGSVAAYGQFPFYLLFIADGDAWCGSSLLSASWVITAAHCIVGQPYANVYSTINTTLEYAWTSQISEYFYYPDGATGYVYDFALVKLVDAGTFSDSIDFIGLPTPDGNGVYPSYAGDSSTFAGFGGIGYNASISSVLLYLTTTVMDNSDCSNDWSIDSNQLCTLFPAGQSACPGDSGGGLFVGDINDNNGRTLIGVVSYGNADCALGYPVVYVRVSQFVSVISSIILE